MKQFITCLYNVNQQYVSDYGKIYGVQNIDFYILIREGIRFV